MATKTSQHDEYRLNASHAHIQELVAAGISRADATVIDGYFAEPGQTASVAGQERYRRYCELVSKFELSDGMPHKEAAKKAAEELAAR